MTPEEALAIYHAGPEVVVKALCELSNQVELLQKQVAELHKEVQRLKDQLAKNSRNSSKPPSSDGFNRPAPKSLRPQGKRKPGGQKGHSGFTLKMVDNPDHIIPYPVDQCQRCSRCLANEAPIDVEKRQVFDIPPMQVEKSPNIKPRSSHAPIAGISTEQHSPNRSRPQYNMARD